MSFNVDSRASGQSGGNGGSTVSATTGGESSGALVKRTVPAWACSDDSSDISAISDAKDSSSGSSIGHDADTSSSGNSGGRSSSSSTRGSTTEDTGSSCGSRRSSFSNGVRQGPGRPRVSVDENIPLVRSSDPSGRRASWLLRVCFLILGLLWVAFVTTLLLLRFLPAAAEGTRSRYWRDAASSSVGMCGFVLVFMTAFCGTFYCVCLRGCAGCALKSTSAAR